MDSYFNIFKLERFKGLTKEESEKIDSSVGVSDFRKKSSKINKKVRENIKPKTCLICGKESSSFCNSHSIPKFVLENIAVNGQVLFGNAVINYFFEKKERGLNQAGIFRLICNECDSKTFQNYEDESILINECNNLMLSEIALKCSLKKMYEKRLLHDLQNVLQQDTIVDEYTQKRLSVNKNVASIDIFDANRSMNYALSSIQGKNKGYYLFFKEILNYTVPIAFQNQLTVITDFEGNTVNNIYNLSTDYEIKELYLCIYPLKKKTIVLMFFQDGDTRYRKFRKCFNKLSLNEKLEVINYLIFLYSDEFFISPSVSKELLNDKNLKYVSSMSGNYSALSFGKRKRLNPLPNTIKAYDLNNRLPIPNFLSEKLSINNL